MNSQIVRGTPKLEALVKELTDYKRPICYNLSEIMVVPIHEGCWFVAWRKDNL